MTDKTEAADAVTTTAELDPLACFVPSAKEREGVWIDIENPNTGEVLLRWHVARFGGTNNPKIVRAERELKAKLTQGQRRAIDQGVGDPDVVTRLNRQVFIKVASLGWEMVHPTLKKKYGEYSFEMADQMLGDYPIMYDQLSERATDEQTWAADQLDTQKGN